MIKKLLLCTIAVYLMVLMPKTLVEAEDEPDYLCFTNVGVSQLGFSLERTNRTGAENVTLEYRVYSSSTTSWGEWLNFNYLNDDFYISLNSQDKVQIRNTSTTTTPFSTSDGATYTFVAFTRRGSLSVSGDVTTLININGNIDVLPAYCFNKLFYGFEFLTSASDLNLHSKSLGNYCYAHMFDECTELLSMPTLPATTIGDYCYSFMFNKCEALTSAIASLPAMNLTSHCYDAMFNECHNLITAPELPATTLAERCYAGMFANCYALQSAPELPAIELKEYCYYRMFNGCKGMTTAPTKLPALELASNCYNGMFGYCEKITKIPEIKAQKLAEKCCFEMFNKCKELVDVPELPAKELASNCYEGMFSECEKLKTSPVLPATKLAPVCYKDMFNKCISLINPPKLPATELANNCYEGMFNTCNSLEVAPALPVKELANNCYYKMFYNCKLLKNAPVLPATVMATGCYSYMFYSCESLTDAPLLPAKTLASTCYAYMFDRCTSLTEAPKLPATQLAPSCYSNMFGHCSELIQAPKLPAMEMAEGCYYSMFTGCLKLEQAPKLPATTLADLCYSAMFVNCTKLTEAPALPATTLAPSCYESMFSNCNNLVALPLLPATGDIPDRSYNSMFSGCTSLHISGTQDDTHTVPYRIPSEGTVAPNSIFVGMFPRTTPGLSNGTAKDDDSDGIITLYLEQYYVEYDKNGGNGEVAKQQGDFNSVIKIATGDALSKEELHFNGWNTKADGTGDIYLPGDNYKINGYVTLYAMWEKYIFTKGTDQTYTINSNNDILFVCDGEDTNLSKVQVDNEDKTINVDYTVAHGSTKITLKSACLNNLSEGWHTLKAIYNDGGEATTRFYIKKPTYHPEERHVVLNTGIN